MFVFPIPKTVTEKMDSVQMRFWWKKQKGNKGCYFVKWKKVAQPRELGGLNIKQTEIMNLALLAKLSRRMLHPQDALWYKIMKGKYFPLSDPFSDPLTNTGSWIWNGICRGLDIIKKYVVWEVGNGDSVCIWKDKWIPSIPTTVNNQFYSSCMKTVSQLIDADTKSWNLPMLNALLIMTL